jgi:UDP-glucose 4-epimerase
MIPDRYGAGNRPVVTFRIVRALVTGGTGFIGSHVVDHLVAAGHDVGVIDLRTPHRPDVDHLPVDVGDLDGLVEATVGADAVFHLAAFADVNDVHADPVGAVEINVLGTTKVWEACRRNDVKRAILASTVWVFGASPDDGSDLLDETSPFAVQQAGHLYTSSKLASELVAHSYYELYGQEFTVLRYGIPYGPRMRPALVIPKFVTMALEGKPITINGDGSQHRNYLYVEDLAQAHVLALGEAGVNQVFDLEGSEQVTMRHLVDAISTALGRELDVTYGESRAGDYAGRPISARKADELLGWHPTVSFADGLLRYVDWHHQNVAAPVAVASAVLAPAVLAPAVLAPAESTPAEVMPVPVGAVAATEVPIAPPAVPELVPSRSIAAVTGASAAVLLAPTLSLAERPALAIAALVAALAAAVLSRQLPRVPRLVAAGATLVGIGLLGVTTQTLVVLAAATLIGVALPQPPPRARWREWAAGAALGSATLITINRLEPSSLLWSAAVLGVATSGAAISSPGWAIRRESWRAGAIAIVAAVMLVGWSGATNAGASWFGSVVTHGPRDTGRIAITFDGDASDTNVAAIQKELDDGGATATWFLTPDSIAADPAVAQGLVAHGQLTAIAADGLSNAAGLDGEVLDRAQDTFKAALGTCSSYLRPAHAWHTPISAAVAHDHGMQLVTWETRISRRSSTITGSEVRISSIRPGAIVAFDLDNPYTPAAVQDLLDYARSHHLAPTRLDHLLDTTPPASC